MGAAVYASTHIRSFLNRLSASRAWISQIIPTHNRGVSTRIPVYVEFGITSAIVGHARERFANRRKQAIELGIGQRTQLSFRMNLCVKQHILQDAVPEAGNTLLRR